MTGSENSHQAFLTYIHYMSHIPSEFSFEEHPESQLVHIPTRGTFVPHQVQGVCHMGVAVVTEQVVLSNKKNTCNVTSYTLSCTWYHSVTVDFRGLVYGTVPGICLGLGRVQSPVPVPQHDMVSLAMTQNRNSHSGIAKTHVVLLQD